MNPNDFPNLYTDRVGKRIRDYMEKDPGLIETCIEALLTGWGLEPYYVTPLTLAQAILFEVDSLRDDKDTSQTFLIESEEFAWALTRSYQADHRHLNQMIGRTRRYSCETPNEANTGKSG